MEIIELIHKKDYAKISELLSKNEISLIDILKSVSENLYELRLLVSYLPEVSIGDWVASLITVGNEDLICDYAEILNNSGLYPTYINMLGIALLKNPNTLTTEYITWFAQNIKGAPISEFADYTIKNGDYSDIKCFVEGVPNIPSDVMKRLTETYIKINNYGKIIAFVNHSKEMPDAAFEVVADWLCLPQNLDKILFFIGRNMLTGVCQKCIPRCVLTKLCNTALETKNFSYMNEFVELMSSTVHVDELPWEDFTDAIIISTNDLENIYKFSKFRNADKTKIARVLIKSKSFKWVYKFAKDIENITEDIINDIVSFVESTNCPEYIYLFLRNIPLSIGNMSTLTKTLIKTEDVKYINYFLLSLGTRNDEEIEIIKELLMRFINENNDREWMRNYNPDIHQELEQKLLDSDDSIQNPFTDVPEQDKRMQL